jgi:2-keto-4-pentenoate hydratase/2-oxohepta-3-ene-1,7-dioic acid hydratase in catechol pathway
MKIVRYINPDKKIEYGILEGEVVRGIKGEPYSQIDYSGSSYKVSQLKLLAPCTPSKIVGVHANCEKILKKFGLPIPTHPPTFFKPLSSIINPGENIVYPETSNRVDYEGELAFIMKAKAWHVSKEDALKHVLGYTCFNDCSALDWIFDEDKRDWAVGKGYDTFSPFGPCIETELNPLDCEVEVYINDKLATTGNTKDLIYSVIDQIEFLSHVMTLLPGDIVTTGTAGTQDNLNKGEKVEVKIKEIGTLTNYVV